MLKFADICKHIQKIYRKMHNLCKNMQAYAFYNTKYANIWYYMQEYAKNMKKYVQITGYTGMHTLISCI